MREKIRPPRENLVRAVYPGIELRDASEGDAPTLFGHFSVFNQWAEIDSMWEGNFMERIAPGAFAKTFRESRQKILLQHGRDPQLGQKPIAALDAGFPREDETGAYYEARLLDGMPPLVVSGLREGQYGASFTFTVMREDIVNEPKASAYNPKALPERTVREVQCPEFGPVTWGAYDNATSGVRSLTDEFMLDRLLGDRKLLAAIASTKRGEPGERTSKHQLLIARLKPVVAKVRASTADPQVLATIAQIDLLVDAADELVDTLMDEFGIPDPDEIEEGEPEEPAAAGANSKRKKSSAPSRPGAGKAATPGRSAAPEAPRFKTQEEWDKWISKNSIR